MFSLTKIKKKEVIHRHSGFIADLQLTSFHLTCVCKIRVSNTMIFFKLDDLVTQRSKMNNLE